MPEPALARSSLFHEVVRLLRPLWVTTFVATALGGLSGLATAVLLARINRGLHATESDGWGFFAAFGALALLAVFGRAAAGVGNSLTGQRIIAALRKDISARILQAPIAALEGHRLHRLIAVLNSDIETVSAFSFNISGYAVSLAITLGCVIYLFILSPALFALAAVALIAGALLSHRARSTWMKDYSAVREDQDELQKQYHAITQGAKELRGHRARRGRVFFTYLSEAVDRIAARKGHAMRLFWIADAVSSGIFFIVIGALLLVRARLDLDVTAVSGFVIVLLYVKGPLDQLVGALPVVGQAQVAFRRVAELSAEFSNAEPGLLKNLSKESTRCPHQIKIRGVRYTYPEKRGEQGFSVGPIDMDVDPGEILFIVGDNGSGKTTLIKILLGLYVPQSGELLCDGEPVTDATRDDYRQIFTTIFTDYYLFGDLICEGDTFPQEAYRYLERLGIADKVRIENGAFSTTDLSTGQRKRLALIQAWLDDRPVLVFDEWAADQDPSFRQAFYTELLPDFRARGRTLIVISHDDRYFHIADRVIRMDRGVIVSVERQLPQPFFASPGSAA